MGLGLQGLAFVLFKLKGSYRTTAQKAKSSKNKQRNKQHKRLKILFRPNGEAGTSSWAVWTKTEAADHNAISNIGNAAVAWTRYNQSL